MKNLALPLLSLLLSGPIAHLAFGEEAQETQKNNTKEEVSAPTEQIIQAIPSEIEIELETDFNTETGKVRRTSNRMQIEILVPMPADIDVIEPQATITAIILDDGSKLKASRTYIYDRGERGLEVNINCKAPPSSATAITAIRGTITGQVATSIKRAVISPLQDWVGKRIALPDADNLEITIESVSKSEVKYVIDDELEKIIKDATFTNATGNTISSSGGGSSGNGSTTTVTRRLRGLANSMALTFYANTEPSLHKFICADLPLPRNSPAPKEVTLLPAVEVNEVAPAEASSGIKAVEAEGIQEVNSILPSF